MLGNMLEPLLNQSQCCIYENNGEIKDDDLCDLLIKQVVRMMIKPKFKQHWLCQPDNSQVEVRADTQQKYLLEKFIKYDWFQNHSLFCSIIEYLPKLQYHQIPISQISTEHELYNCINMLLNDYYIVVQIYSQYGLSYKGFISWMLLGNSNGYFLLDGISLRNCIESIRIIFQNCQVIKLVLDAKETTRALKRDFSIFSINVFDLCCLETQYESLIQVKSALAKQFSQQILKTPNLLVQRPITSQMCNIVHNNFQILISYIQKLSKQSSSKSQTIYQFQDNLSQNYEKINKTQLASLPYHHEIQFPLTEQEQNELDHKQNLLYETLIQFREHVAKVNDISSEKILPKPVISSILANSKISVLEISWEYQSSNCPSIGLELCKRIYDLIQLNEEMCQDRQKLQPQIFKIQSSSKNTDPSKTIKQLLKDIQWGNSNDWLNRRDDPSIKLYKSIISIEEFDHTIGQEYFPNMKGDVIKKCHLAKYRKYAQYMRNKNYQKLEKLYEMNQIKQANKDDDCCQQILDKPQSEITKQESISSKQQIKPKSSTSLQQKIKKDKKIKQQKIIKSAVIKDQHIKSIPNIQSSEDKSQSNRSSSSSQLYYAEFDQHCINRSDIKPLPNTIQEVYKMALQVKEKSEKKTNTKKQKKLKTDIPKSTQFVPTWEDIQKLITSTSNIY